MLAPLGDWRGFIKAAETARLKTVLLKARRHGYLPTDFLSHEDLLESKSLFRSIRYNTQHVLHQLLQPPKHTGYNLRLRSRGHGLNLSVIHSELMRKNFINRMLLNAISFTR